jgi:putative PIN family toxin of toxin-antitoxin system
VKIVLDNTILVRAHEQAHGLGRALLTTLIESKHALLLSNEMLHELARVLRYPRLQEFFGLTEDLVYAYVAFLRRSAKLVTLNPLLTAPIREQRIRLTIGGHGWTPWSVSNTFSGMRFVDHTRGLMSSPRESTLHCKLDSQLHGAPLRNIFWVGGKSILEILVESCARLK